MDERQQVQVNEAAEKFAEAIKEFGSKAEGNKAITKEIVEAARNKRGAFRTLFKESVVA